MTSKRVIESREQYHSLLTERGEVTANATEHRHPVFGTETPRDLLLHFDHAQIALRLVIVKRHGKIVQEAQHGPLPSREAIQQIARRALFGSPACALGLVRLARCAWRGIGQVAFNEDGVIATKQVGM